MLKRFGCGVLLLCGLSPLFAGTKAVEKSSTVHYVLEIEEEDENAILEFVATENSLSGRLCQDLDIFNRGYEERDCLTFDKVALDQETYTFVSSFEQFDTVSVIHCTLKISKTEGGKGSCYLSKDEENPIQKVSVLTVEQARKKYLTKDKSDL